MKYPYCGKLLTYSDTIDTEQIDEQYMEKEVYYCEHCSISFLRQVYWKMVYNGDEWGRNINFPIDNSIII